MPDIARTPRALSIAGSDSGGGAGIQADLKAFARCGVHGMSAITAITAQNTLGVEAVHALPPEIVLAQIRAVVADIGVDAVKVGMLGSIETVRAVALALDELPAETPVVVDPVMVSESGARLLDRDAESALVAEILPRANIVTPNIPEARVLAGHAAHLRHGEPIETTPEDEESEAIALALAVCTLGPGIVVLTGGHREQTIDLFLERGAKAEEIVEIPGERYPDGAAHGSGCTHSSVLAAQLALGHTPLQAAFTARALAGEAVAAGLRDVGEGPGPVDVIGLDRLRSA
ncbi:MAG: bifunctional hydroxymethylpyrimidine kinase/phosphomethylpyrimidine kinase [Solirubrobacteraceae bacterium]